MNTDTKERLNAEQLNQATKKTIESRFQQSNGSRLAEVITGMRPEDPSMLDKLIEIQERIYDKYSFPDFCLSFSDQEEFRRSIDQKLKQIGVSFLTKTETQDFFNKYPQLYATYFPQKNAIGINTERQKEPTYSDFAYNTTITHESIHALQYFRGDPKFLSIELLEFEATIASTALSPFKDQKLRQRLTTEQISQEMTNIFDNLYLSVEAWGQQGGSTNKENYSPESILKKIDHITEQQIALYKKTNSNNTQ